MKLKRFVSSLLTVVMILGMITVVPTTIATTPVDAASSLLSAAKKNGTAKTPTAAQQAQIDQKFAGVVCWGDSLTAGTGYGGAAYPYRLGEYIASNLIAGFNSFTKRVNYGVGGEAAQSICARANVVPATLKNAVTIPASGSVSISINVSVFGQTAGGSNYAGLQGVDGPSTAVINGVAGTLSGRGYNLTFTRSTAGSAVQCNAGTAVTFSCGNLYDNKNYIPIVYMGYNNGADWCNTNFSTYSSYIDKIINKYPMGRAGRYVVVCPHFALDKVSVCKQVEAQMEAKYGSHLIKTREFIVTNGFAATGLTPTSEDNTRLAAGQIPPTFLAVDNTHFNNAGSDLITRMIYQKLYDLGYFNEVISILGINLTPGTGGGGGDTPTHTHTPGAAATCTTPQKCTSCQAVIAAALGHNYVNGKCSRCGATDPSAAAAYTTSVNESCNTGLSQKYNFDLYSGGSGYGYGKLSFAQCVDRTKVATAAAAKKVEASAIGAYMTRGVLLDSNANNSGMSWLSTVANGSERVYANGVINGDAPYVVYKVKAPSGTIDTVNVKVNAGNLNKLRGAVYVTDNLGYNNSTGSLNFSSFKFLGSFEGSNFTGFYPEAEAKSFTLASGQISGKSELYVVIALSNFSEAAGDAERLSGVTTTNARITAIQIEATASGSTPTHTHTPGAAASCTTPQICTSCKDVLVAALGHDYVSGECTRCGAVEGGQQDQPTGKVLSIAQHYDLFSHENNFDTGSNDDGTYGIGCLTVKPSITRNDVSASASSKSVSASTVGAYAIHNIFLDCSNANNKAMSFLATVPTGSQIISESGDVSGDAPYVAYKISSGDASSYIKSLTVDINAGHLYKFRYSVFVTDSLKYKNQSTGEMDFSSYTKIGNISCENHDTFYNPYGEDDGAKRYTLSASQLSAIGDKSELYVVIATNSYRASGAGCLSGTDTGDSRITAVIINATASDPAPVHTHSMQHTAAVTATCKAAGNIEYWYCTGCQKYFSDAKGDNEITQQATVIAKSTVHSFGQEYTSNETSHWKVCSACGATNTPASHIPNVDQPTETTAKYCTICKYEIAPIVTHTHTMQHTAAVAATCKAAGNIEYWYCTGCQKYFSDAKGDTAITQQATVIAKSTVHSFGQEYTSNETSHWKVCSACGATSTPASHIPNVEQPTTTTAKYCEICKYEIEPKIGEVVIADLTNDGVVTMADIGMLFDAIDAGTTASLNQSADFNKDGVIDDKDGCYVLGHIFRPDLYPLTR